MCSINGFTWRDESLIRRMNSVTEHRGPDGTGVFLSPHISLGHNRLSIIDLSEAGAQPMKSADGRFVITFNGEIYNYRELRKELSSYPFKSESDTEVILAAWTAWGAAALSRFQGIFALALYDTREHELFLVRDPVGVKPLYYHSAPAEGEGAGRLVFSSEIKAIIEHPHIIRRIDPRALDIYLRILYTPAPLTMFAGIKKLLPGHLLSYKHGALAARAFDAPRAPLLSTRSRDALEAELAEQAHASVRRQLVSDRPVGLYLSGGIDSSIVLESMSAASSKVETFSVGFNIRAEEERDKFNADFMLARRSAAYFGAAHHEVLVEPDEVPSLFAEAIYHLDEPSANATIVPMLKLSRITKQSVAVVLGGDGGDELFGGYERYRLSLASSRYHRFPAVLRRGAEALLPTLKKLDTAPGVERFAQFLFQKEDVLRPVLAKEAYHPGVAERFFAETFFSSTARTEDFERQFMDTDRRSWLVDESLLRTDKLGMAGGLEARVPLLDLPLVAFADTIPVPYKVTLRRTKIILKDAFKNRLPRELLHQPKRGWFSPGAKWLRYPIVASMARAILSKGYCAATGNLFNWDAVRERLDAHREGAYHANMLFALLGFQVWAQRFKVQS